MLVITMGEEQPKALNYISEVVLKKRKSNEARALIRKDQFERRTKKNDKTRIFIKRPQDYIIEHRSKELDLIRMRRRTKRKLPTLKSKLLLAVRIQGKNDMHQKTRKILYSLRLRRNFAAVFLKATESTLAKLQMVEPYVTYGYPNIKNVRDLIFKRGYGRVDKKKAPLTDNNLIERELGKYGIICIEDMVREITDVGPHFKEVTSFLWPFALSKPQSGLQGSKTVYKQGGDTGNREDNINELIDKMN